MCRFLHVKKKNYTIKLVLLATFQILYDKKYQYTTLQKVVLQIQCKCNLSRKIQKVFECVQFTFYVCVVREHHYITESSPNHVLR